MLRIDAAALNAMLDARPRSDRGRSLAQPRLFSAAQHSGRVVCDPRAARAVHPSGSPLRRNVVLTSEDGVLASLAVNEAPARGRRLPCTTSTAATRPGAPPALPLSADDPRMADQADRRLAQALRALEGHDQARCRSICRGRWTCWRVSSATARRGLRAGRQRSERSRFDSIRSNSASTFLATAAVARRQHTSARTRTAGTLNPTLTAAFPGPLGPPIIAGDGAASQGVVRLTLFFIFAYTRPEVAVGSHLPPSQPTALARR